MNVSIREIRKMKKIKIVIQTWNQRLKVFRGTEQILNIYFDKDNFKVIIKRRFKGKIINRTVDNI